MIIIRTQKDILYYMIHLYVESKKIIQMNLFTKTKTDSQTQKTSLWLSKVGDEEIN